GDCDFLLRIVVSNLEQYRQFQTDNLGQIEGIQNMKTEIPMQLIKQTLELPI
nr:Lrp/AsnC ligand binding domain-containing protein [Brachymonas sp.]